MGSQRSWFRSVHTNDKLGVSFVVTFINLLKGSGINLLVHEIIALDSANDRFLHALGSLLENAF